MAVGWRALLFDAFHETFQNDETYHEALIVPCTPTLIRRMMDIKDADFTQERIWALPLYAMLELIIPPVSLSTHRHRFSASRHPLK